MKIVSIQWTFTVVHVLTRALWNSNSCHHSTDGVNKLRNVEYVALGHPAKCWSWDWTWVCLTPKPCSCQSTLLPANCLLLSRMFSGPDRIILLFGRCMWWPFSHCKSANAEGGTTFYYSGKQWLFSLVFLIERESAWGCSEWPVTGFLQGEAGMVHKPLCPVLWTSRDLERSHLLDSSFTSSCSWLTFCSLFCIQNDLLPMRAKDFKSYF